MAQMLDKSIMVQRISFLGNILKCFAAFLTNEDKIKTFQLLLSEHSSLRPVEIQLTRKLRIGSFDYLNSH